MVYPRDYNGRGVVMAPVADEGVKPTAYCAGCGDGLSASKNDIKASKTHRVPIMDAFCAEAYVTKGIRQ